MEVVVSRPTGRTLLDDGVRHCVDDICVPVKLYYGHVLDLRDEVDVLFLSRMVSVENDGRDNYTCPKLIGLPDMIKSSVEGLPEVVEFVIDLQSRSLPSSARRLASALGCPASLTRRSLPRALRAQEEYRTMLLRGLTPSRALRRLFGDGPGGNGNGSHDLRIALVGHEYLIHDDYLSHDLSARLSGHGASVEYTEQVPPEVIEAELERYPGISWSYEKELLGAASHFLNRDDIDGVILVMCFACGPDSIVGEIINREVRGEESPPMMTLVLDEHTGEAGVQTRVEAFVDMIRRARNN